MTSPALGSGLRMSERSLLVQRLSDQADVCVDDCVRLAQLAIVVDRQVR